MAITTTIIGINTGNAGTWTGNDLINQLETAFNWLGWNGGTQTGLVVGVSSISGGGTVGSAVTYYESVKQSSTTGVGTGALFYVGRGAHGKVNEIFVNRSGYGYTGGEIVTLASADIGGGADLTVKVCIAGTVSGAVSYAVTFTSTYVSAGQDRNGVVSGSSTIITVYEGDTLSLTNTNSGPSFRTLNIIWNPNQLESNMRATNIVGAANTNRVFNVVNQNAGIDGVSGGICTVTFLPGQAGTYWIKSENIAYPAENTTYINVLPVATSSVTPTGIGSTASFYDKNITGAQKYGVLRHTIQANKLYGDTYRAFMVPSGTTSNIAFMSGSGYNALAEPDAARSSYNYNGGAALSKRFTGAANLDLSAYNIFNTAGYLQPSSANALTASMTNQFYSDTVSYANYIKTGNNTTYQLDLDIYRSGIDPNFVVFSYSAPTLSSTHLLGRTFSTFFFHNFTTNLWDLNHVFLGGFTYINALNDSGSASASYITGTSSNPSLSFRSSLSGSKFNSNSNVNSLSCPTKRMAEFGYASYNDSSYDLQDPVSSAFATSEYSSLINAGTVQDTKTVRPYYRDSNALFRSKGGYAADRRYANRGSEQIASDTNYNAVIKGLPLNAAFMPVPYYIPDDFVLIQFRYPNVSANIQQGDTITISGSEVYTVITGSYDNVNSNATRGILFCGRTV